MPVANKAQISNLYRNYRCQATAIRIVTCQPPGDAAPGYKGDRVAQPNVVGLSLIGTSLPVLLLYCPRMKSEICSSLACSTADSLF